MTCPTQNPNVHPDCCYPDDEQTPDVAPDYCLMNDDAIAASIAEWERTSGPPK